MGIQALHGYKICEHDANYDYMLSGNDEIPGRHGGNHDAFFLVHDVYGDDGVHLHLQLVGL